MCIERENLQFTVNILCYILNMPNKKILIVLLWSKFLARFQYIFVREQKSYIYDGTIIYIKNNWNNFLLSHTQIIFENGRHDVYKIKFKTSFFRRIKNLQ